MVYVYSIIWIFIVVAVAAFLSHKKHRRIAQEKITQIDLENIKLLKEEFLDVMLNHYNQKCSNIPTHELCTLIETEMRSAKIFDAFNNKDYKWYFIGPIGAYLGEYLRTLTQSSWELSNSGEPILTFEEDGNLRKIYPFSKVLSQYTEGKEGDIFTFLNTFKK